MLKSESSLTFPFSGDLTDCLLMAVPDFSSLQCFISSSKFVYSIFRCRQNSILGAVAHRQFGHALPQAMRLVRCLSGTRPSRVACELQPEVAFSQDLTVTSAQARLLRDHATVVRTLEDIYSWTEKDPRFGSSRLSAAESVRFQQSVYRLWLLAATYGPGALLDERIEYDNGNHSHLQLQESIVKRQTMFLSSLEECERMGVEEVHRFFLNLAKWAFVKHATLSTRSRLGFGDRDGVYLVWSGPAVVLNAFLGKWPLFRPVDSDWYGAWRAMTYTFFAMENASVTGGRVLPTTRQRYVLDDYFLQTIDCSRCGGSPSPSRRDSLWSFCNWDYMILAIAPSRLGSCLSLERNRPLERLVSFAEAVELIPYRQFIEEIFDVRSERYKEWRKDEWLCTYCMTKMLCDSVQTWFDKRVVKKAVAAIAG